MNYYNEHEPYAAQWLKNLIEAEHIPAGQVDGRDIRLVQASDLKGFAQCHFFAGIAGWSYALRLAGWTADQPVWTGSCPCQPFSAAGKQQGFKDERDLWPDWFRLIRECRPATIFGEQVASAIGFGWLDRVFLDLEGEDYACAAAVLPACSVGAPHIRSRLFWVAESSGARRETPSARPEIDAGNEPEPRCGQMAGGLAVAASEQVGRAGQPRQCAAHGMGSPIQPGLERHAGDGDHSKKSRRKGAYQAGSAWAASELIYCLDGKTRRIGSGIQPLAYGISARVGKLRAAGNAIVPQVAAEFIKASL